MRHGKHVWLVVKGWGSETLFFTEADARSWHESNAAGYPEGTPSQLIRYTRDDAGLVDARLAALEAERDALQQVIDAWLPKHKCAACGQEFNMHLLIPEEGDRWECEPCNRRLDAMEPKP